MKLNIYTLFLVFFLCVNQMVAQSITVDDNRSSTDLVNLLIGNSCSITSNISISSSQSVGYFNKNGSAFPINEGVIIRSGIAAHSQGIYTGNNLDSQINTNSDPDLQQISNASGQVSQITDVAFLEFDFVPPSTDFNFNFLFSSNEYGEWQCGFSDVFAFILTDLVTGEKINLAIVPTSGNPISVKEIRDNTYNSSCNSVNPELFGAYNVNNPANSSMNMRGHTVVMNASATIKPNNPYRIKLVIGDYNDSRYDSAVFIEAGSFGNFVNLGDDKSICIGESTILDSGFTNTTDFSYEWKKDNVTIIGETSPTLSINQTGTYDVLITNNGTSCVLSDQIVISELKINKPIDLFECQTPTTSIFDLTENSIISLGLDPTKYRISYYSSLNNLNNNVPINPAAITNYPSTGSETIYIRVFNIDTTDACTETDSFQLIVNSVVATKPANISACEGSTIDFPLEVNSQILNGLNPAQHEITFFTSLNDAQNNTNAIANPTQYGFSATPNTFSIWVRLTETSPTACFDITDFTVQVNPIPTVVDLDHVFACSSYTLQPLGNGNYFTGPNGTGTQLSAGDVITNSTTLFIYAEENGCSNQTSFNVTLVDEFTMETEYCGEFSIPEHEIGMFYTAPNGPDGTGTLIPSGTVLTSNQTIYFYSEFENLTCTNYQFDIIIHPLPAVDTLNDVTICLSYTLPNLVNGRYYTNTGGSGTQLNPGDAITSTQTIYIYDIDGNMCSNETSFDVNIIDTTQFQDLSSCGSYTVPSLIIGNFYTQSLGQGTIINAGTVITTSQTIYFYEPTINNCADDIPIDITILPLPPVDSLPDFVTCIDSPMSLPTLTNGNYFTATGGTGTQLNAGDVITTTQTIYIYNHDGTCPNETNFSIEVRPLPPLNSFTDVFSCTPYTLPVLSNGKYFSQPGGTGTQLNPGDIINTTQVIYIYNEYDDLKACNNEAFITIHIIGVEVDKPADVNSCDTYTLPNLTSGNYYTESNGNGVQLNAGDILTSTQTLYIYKDNGDRFFCSDEHIFTVTIFNTPQLPTYNNVESCNNYTLPDLTLAGATINYYRQPNKVDLISPSEYLITDIGTQTIYVHASAIGNDNCSSESQFQLTVHPLLDFTVQGGIICVDAETNQTTNPFLLQSGLDPAIFTVNWYLENQLVGTGENYSATKAGTYTVETIKLIADVGADCNYNSTQVEVKESKPKVEIIFLTNAFISPASIRIDFIDKGFGTYEFQLDNGAFQSSNEFFNLDFGPHTLTIRDLTGICNINTSINFNVINYPRFFSPNNDGTNDTWNIKDLVNHPEAVISIYNRLGKLITRIKPSDIGWEGTNENGTKVPSTDYWFKVDFIYQGKPTTYSSNFSLLRK